MLDLGDQRGWLGGDHRGFLFDLFKPPRCLGHALRRFAGACLPIVAVGLLGSEAFACNGKALIMRG